MAELSLTQVRSTAGSNRSQRETLRSLKLGRIGKRSTLTDTPQLRGMLRAVGHLVTVDEDGKGASSKRGEG